MVDFFKIPVWLRRLRESPMGELTRWQRAVRFSIELAIHCARELRHDKATQMAAALTFHTLFSLLPMLVIALVAMNAFVGPEDREAFKEGLVDWAVNVLQEGEATVLPVFGAPMLNVDLEEGQAERERDAAAADAPDDQDAAEDATAPERDGPPADEDADAPAEQPADAEPQLPGDASPRDLVPGDPVGEIRQEMAERQDADADEGDADQDLETDPATEQEADALVAHRQEFEQVRERLDQELSNLLNTLERVDIRGIGVVGVLLFIYGATALLATIEESFNAIFGSTSGRPWYIRLPLYYTLITLGPVVLVGAQVLQTQLFNMLEVRDWTNWLVGPAGFLAPILATWLVLFLLYALMPNATVAKRAAAGGSLVAAILWVITKDLFSLYVSHGVMGSLYGALALVPLFLMWLWATWIIVLFGLELTFTTQAMRGRRLKHEVHKQPEDMVIDPAVLVPLATQLAASFEQGKPVSLSELSEAANLPARVIRKMMAMLEDAHIVHRVEDTVTQSYTLARPADRISLDEVLLAAEQLLPKHVDAGADPAQQAWRFVGKLHDATHRIAEQRTLASLLNENGKSDEPTPGAAVTDSANSNAPGPA